MSVFDRIDAMTARVSDWIGDSGSRLTFVVVAGLVAATVVLVVAIGLCVSVFGGDGPNCPPGTTPQTYTEGYGKTRSTYDYCLAVR